MVIAYLQALRSFLRVPTYLLMLLYYLMGLIVAAGSYRWWTVLFGPLIIAAWYINATSLNDLADIEIDQINLRGDRDRPLVVGALSRRQIIAVAAGSAVLALLLAAALGWLALGLVAVMLGFNAAYSLPPAALSRRGGWALALLPFGYAVFTLTLGILAASGRPTAGLVWLIATCYLQFLARISLKDYRDVAGDAKFGKRTFLLRHGSAAVVRLALTGHALAAIGGIIWLYPSSPVRAAGYVFLAAMAASMLSRLGKTHGWERQRVWIAAYGRLVSGQLIILLLGALAARGFTGTATQDLALLAIVVAAFTWSARQIMLRQGSAQPPRRNA